MVPDDEVLLPDGRRAQLWYRRRRRTARRVLVFHGCPDTRWVARTGEAAARAVGVRLVCVNRPGYGTLDAAASTTERRSRTTRSPCWTRSASTASPCSGMSVGGAYAAALAARHPDRVAALGVVASPAETRADDGAVEAMVEQARPEFDGLGRHRPRPPTPTTTPSPRAGSRLAPGRRTRTLLAPPCPTADVAASVREALAQPDGYLRDAALPFRRLGRPTSRTSLPHPPLVRRAATSAAHPRRRLAGRAGSRTPSSWSRPDTTHLATLLAHWPTILAARPPRLPRLALDGRPRVRDPHHR